MGRNVVIVLLTGIYPDPVAESWSLSGTSNESTCGLISACEEDGVRAVFQRKPVPRNGWGWLVTFAWKFVGQIFIEGTVLCDFQLGGTEDGIENHMTCW